MLKKFKPPQHLQNAIFLSKKAGSFSGVPQRTVQAWTEKDLIKSKTTGSGDRRHYTVFHCIEIGLIKALAQDRQSVKVIKKIMNGIRKGTPLTLTEALGYDDAFLIVRFYALDNIGVTCVSREVYGPRSGFEGKKRTFEQFWQDTTIPKDPEHSKTLIVDLSYIAKKVLRKMS